MEDAVEADEQFRAQFDPKSSSYHGGDSRAVPLGGERVPESMAGARVAAAAAVRPDLAALVCALGAIRDEAGVARKQIAAVLERLSRGGEPVPLAPSKEALERARRDLVPHKEEAVERVLVGVRASCDELEALYMTLSTLALTPEGAPALTLTTQKMYQVQKKLLEHIKQLKRIPAP